MNEKNRAYWHDIYHSRIAILGIFPPPFGGVSVHIKRVMDCFSLQDNMLLFWPTEYKRSFLPWYLIRLWWRLIVFRPKHVYYHSTYLRTSVIELVTLIMLRRIMKYTFSIVDHDCRHLYKRRAFTKRWYQWVVQNSDGIICIGTPTLQSYKDNNINAPNMSVEDAFIPPIERHEGLITATYPSSLTIFIKEHTPILLLSAAHLMRINTKDVYGIDFALQLLANIADEYPDAGLIIGLPQVGDTVYFQSLQKMMKKIGVIERIYILHGNKEIWPLFGRVDLFVRPTLTDGDSISVREALYFKVPVVASDIVQRPDKVHCFVTDNAKDAARVTKKVLQEYVYGPYCERYNLYEKSMQ